MNRLRKNLVNHSIGTTIVVAFSALILAVMIITTYFAFYSIQKELRANASQYTAQLIAQVNAEVEQYVEYMKDVSDFVIGAPSVKQFLETEDQNLRSRVTMQLQSVEQMRGDISNVALILRDGEVLFGNPASRLNQYSHYQKTGWYHGALQHTDDVYVSSSHVQNLIDGAYTWVISFSKAIMDRNGQFWGILLVDLNYEAIDNICANVDLGNQGYIYILDSDGDILWHPQQERIYANLKSEEALTEPKLHLPWKTNEKLDVSIRSDTTDWTIVGVAYVDELQQNPGEIYTTHLLAGIGAMLFAIATAFLISCAITEPLRSLGYTMQQVERGDFSVRSHVESKNEVGQLSENVNHMIAHTQDLMHQLVHNEEQKRQSEWRMLQAQIKPHFIYNTLDSIIWMCKSGNSEDAVEMTSALALLLRNSLGSGKDTVTVQEEMAHVQSYLVIQKMRYAEKLRYEMDVEPESLQCLIPKLIVQPLVENAIYHGIKPKEDGGLIHIAAMCEDEQLLITVEDNGLGMTPAQIERVMNEGASEEASSKIGIRNVNERIRIYFGDEYGLKFFSEPEKGLTALLRLPVRRGEADWNGT